MGMKRNSWLKNLFHPLVMGVMVGCIALSVVELIRLFVPAWNATYLIGA
jgi:xanthine/uracil permease